MRLSGSATTTEEAGELDVHLPDAVGCYLDRIGQHQLLDPEREALLGRAVRDGQRAAEVLADSDAVDSTRRRSLEGQVRRATSARKELVERNLRLVVWIARHYQQRGVDLADLIQEGNIGLLKAVERFDPDLGYRFSTYATWWIRQAVARAAGNAGSTVRIPQNARSKLRRLRAADDDLRQVLGRAPTGRELAQETEIDPKTVSLLLAADRRMVSLSALVGHDSTELGEIFPSGDDSPESLVELRSSDDELHTLVDRLPAAEAKVLTVRFGLDGNPPGTLSEAAATIGVSRERARQIEARALRRLSRLPALAPKAAQVA